MHRRCSVAATHETSKHQCELIEISDVSAASSERPQHKNSQVLQPPNDGWFEAFITRWARQGAMKRTSSEAHRPRKQLAQAASTGSGTGGETCVPSPAAVPSPSWASCRCGQASSTRLLSRLWNQPSMVCTASHMKEGQAEAHAVGHHTIDARTGKSRVGTRLHSTNTVCLPR